MHFATAGHIEGIGALLGHVEGNVLQQLPFQPVPEVPGGDKLAFLTGEGRIVDGKGHLDGGVADFHKGQGLHRLGGAQGAANGDVCHAGQSHDFTSTGLLNGGLAQTIEGIQGHHLTLGLHAGVVIVADNHILVDLDHALLHPAHGDAANILIVVNGGNQHLQGGVGIALGGIDILDDGLEQGL